MKTSEKLKLVYRDPLRKNLMVMLYEFLKESLKHGRFVQEYFSRFAYRKGFPSLDYYVMDPDIGILQSSRIFHSETSQAILEDKLLFYRFCVEHDIPTPKILVYTNQGQLYDLNDQVIDVDQTTFHELVITLIESTPLKSIFIKQTAFFGGFDSYRLDASNWDNRALIEEVYQALISKDYIIQETVDQHERVSALNPDAINTMRVDTYQPLDGPCTIISAYIRLGRSGFVVDNQSSTSGLFIKVNLETQQLEGLGIQLIAAGNETFTHHPDTGVKLDGYQMVQIPEALALIKRACALVNDRLVGWDICFTTQGPIIIEGNHDYHVVMQELANGGYRNHPVYKKILQEAKIHYK